MRQVLLEARQLNAVLKIVRRDWLHHVGAVWEELARRSVVYLDLWGQSWKPAGRWWGGGLDREMLEIDIVSESSDGGSVLIGEAKWSEKGNVGRLLEQLDRKARNAPFAQGKKALLALWLKTRASNPRNVRLVMSRQVLRVLR